MDLSSRTGTSGDVFIPATFIWHYHHPLENAPRDDPAAFLLNLTRWGSWAPTVQSFYAGPPFSQLNYRYSFIWPPQTRQCSLRFIYPDQALLSKIFSFDIFLCNRETALVNVHTHYWCIWRKLYSDPMGIIVCKKSTHRNGSNRGYIAMLSVDKNWRKRGIGSSTFPPSFPS
ncbi:hypothetical protein P691DRAFT_820985, partial [Macrolepiota fuliginosa MF-IS2]